MTTRVTVKFAYGKITEGPYSLKHAIEKFEVTDKELAIRRKLKEWGFAHVMSGDRVVATFRLSP